MKLRTLARHSPPAVRPSSEQAADWYWSMAQRLGTPVVEAQGREQRAQWGGYCMHLR